jgi:hypothetical protein
MYKFSYQGLEPVKVLENVVLPYPQYSDEMPGDTRPIVFMYYYRISDTFGMEITFYKYKGSGATVRHLEFDKTSNKIVKYSTPIHYFSRNLLRRTLKLLLDKNHKNHADFLKSRIRYVNENSYPAGIDPTNVEIGALNINLNKKLSTG